MKGGSPKRSRPCNTDYQLPARLKSICVLNFTKRGCNVDCGASQFADGLVVLIVGLNAWLCG